ncbi:unnamed protein product [Timema podura]|uniref:DUF7153 domain-containing protein n=1 Tax=Timema podura TaxID=61482 RepID=A0ABN7NR01_TIMPD|nr:unnamed protein product [Timema podura]
MSLFLLSVLFPWVHFTEIQDSYRSLQLPKLLQEHQLSSGCILHQGLYREVRGIVPETELPMLTPHDHMSYILLGFKSMENNFNQGQIKVGSAGDMTPSPKLEGAPKNTL